MRPNPPPPQIHATNAWNPTGHNLLPLPGTRLFFTHAEGLNGPRTFVLLGSQQHLTFVADIDGHIDPGVIRSVVIERHGLYPHLVDLEPGPGLPRVTEAAVSSRPPEAASRLPKAGAPSRPPEGSPGVPRVPEGDRRHQRV